MIYCRLRQLSCFHSRVYGGHISWLPLAQAVQEPYSNTRASLEVSLPTNALSSLLLSPSFQWSKFKCGHEWAFPTSSCRHVETKLWTNCVQFVHPTPCQCNLSHLNGSSTMVTCSWVCQGFWSKLLAVVSHPFRRRGKTEFATDWQIQIAKV